MFIAGLAICDLVDGHIPLMRFPGAFNKTDVHFNSIFCLVPRLDY